MRSETWRILVHSTFDFSHMLQRSMLIFCASSAAWVFFSLSDFVTFPLYSGQKWYFFFCFFLYIRSPRLVFFFVEDFAIETLFNVCWWREERESENTRNDLENLFFTVSLPIFRFSDFFGHLEWKTTFLAVFGCLWFIEVIAFEPFFYP